MPTILAGALKRMPGLPANVVAGVPRVEKDPRGGDVVIVLVRPYARDMDRCARCGERGRPYDRLGVRRWRHLDIGCARLLLEHACVCSIESGPCERVESLQMSGRF
ncbi:Uncharacterised protein [Bifidobacterium bifidum]|nr:Uncharacterised protein [Bifidobacterium bifidum]